MKTLKISLIGLGLLNLGSIACAQQITIDNLVSTTRPVHESKVIRAASDDIQIPVTCTSKGSLLRIIVAKNGCDVSYELLDPSGKKVELRNDRVPVGPGTYTLRCTMSGKGIFEPGRYSVTWRLYDGHLGQVDHQLSLDSGTAGFRDCLASWWDSAKASLTIPAGRHAVAIRLSAPIDDWYGTNIWKEGWRLKLIRPDGKDQMTLTASEGSCQIAWTVIEASASARRFTIKVDSAGGNYNPLSPFSVWVTSKKLAKDVDPTDATIKQLVLPPILDVAKARWSTSTDNQFGKFKDFTGLFDALVYEPGDYPQSIRVEGDGRGGVFSYGLQTEKASASGYMMDSDGMIMDGYRGNGRPSDQPYQMMARPLPNGSYTFRLRVEGSEEARCTPRIEGWYPGPNGSIMTAFPISANGAPAFEKLTSWWDENWFVIQPAAHTGMPYLNIEMTPSKVNEFGTNMWDNGYKVVLLERDGISCIGTFNVGQNGAKMWCQPQSNGPFFIRVSSDGGSYNAHDPYGLKAYWSASEK